MSDYKDPGDALREAIDARDDDTLTRTQESNLRELLYTAEERCVLPFRLDIDDALKLAKIIDIAKTATPAQIRKMRM